MSAVVAQGVSKVFNQGRPNQVDALVDIDLTVEPAEFVSLIGPSGCGKSTLLRLIADLIAPTKGAVTVNGKDAHQARVDQEYGMAFQQAGLFDWRTVLRNVELPLELQGVAKAARGARAREALELVKLGDFAGNHPWELSGGMQQRASLCRALIHEPQLLMLDEPFAALDSFTREELWCVMRDLHAARPVTIVLVTHDLREAAFLADRIFCMSSRPGRIVAERQVKFPRPRDLDITYTGEFTDLVHDLRSQIASARQAA
jgi:NitT/TauT family transport system ATP-binding protein